MKNREDIIEFISKHSTLFLDTEDPVFTTNGRGYIFYKSEMTLFFPISKKYLQEKDHNNFDVLVFDPPNDKVIVFGQLSPAYSEEQAQRALKYLIEKRDWSKVDAYYSLYDQRNQKPRKNRYKLKLERAIISSDDSADLEIEL